MGVQAVRIDTDGAATLVDLGDDTLKGFYREIDCKSVDVVRLVPDEVDMWIDDEGLCVAEPEVNLLATALARTFGYTWQAYYGIVVFTATDGEGETVSLPVVWQERLLRIAAQFDASPV